LKNAYFKKVEKWKSLTVGVEEQDNSSENDSKSVSMSREQWYRDTSETYEIILAVNFK